MISPSGNILFVSPNGLVCIPDKILKRFIKTTCTSPKWFKSDCFLYKSKLSNTFRQQQLTWCHVSGLYTLMIQTIRTCTKVRGLCPPHGCSMPPTCPIFLPVHDNPAKMGKQLAGAGVMTSPEPAASRAMDDKN